MKRCTLCILPNTYPGIKFNEDGICSFCLAHRSSAGIDWDDRRSELGRILEEAQKQSGRYDVIVPWSGGKDSTYVLYIMVKSYGLRVVAINYDNGFQSEAALRNLTAVRERLGVDLISIRPNWDLMKRMYVAYLRQKGEFCTVCNVVGYAMILSHVMKERAVLGYSPLVVGGWSSTYEAEQGIYAFEYRSFAEVLQKEGGLLEEFETSPLIEKTVCDLLRYLGDPRVGAKYDRNRYVNAIQLPDYIPWNLQNISETLKKEAGWEAPKHLSDETHFDCIMTPVAKYFSIKKWGFAQDSITYSSMIRNKQMSRQKALQLVEAQHPDEPPIMEEFLRRLEATRDDINWEADWYTGDNG